MPLPLTGSTSPPPPSPSPSDLRLYALHCFDVLSLRLRLSPPSFLTAASLPHAASYFPLFITWNIRSQSSGNWRLRGCIGNFEPLRLEEGLGEYAIVSAMKDRRFEPVRKGEFERLQCGISLLVNFEPAKDYLDWEIGKHGIYITFPHPAYATYPSSPSSEEEEEEEEEELEPVPIPSPMPEGSTIPAVPSPMSLASPPTPGTPGTQSTTTSTSTGSSKGSSVVTSSTSVNEVEEDERETKKHKPNPPISSEAKKASSPPKSKSKSTSLLRSSLSRLLPSSSHAPAKKPPPPAYVPSLSSTYLPFVAVEQEWDHIETIDSLIRKAGWNGEIDERVRKSLKVERYQALKAEVDWEEWKRWRDSGGEE